MSTNDITGDEIKSKLNTKAYENNYDLIFKAPIEEVQMLLDDSLEEIKVRQMNLPFNEYPNNHKDEGWED